MEPLSSIPVTVYSFAGTASEVTTHAYIVTPGSNEYVLHLPDETVSHSLSVYDDINGGIAENDGSISCNANMSQDGQFVDGGSDINSFELGMQGLQAGISSDIEITIDSPADVQNHEMVVAIDKNRKV